VPADSRGQSPKLSRICYTSSSNSPSAFRTDLHYFERFDFLLLPAFLNAIAQPLGAVNLAAGIDAHESFPAANRLLQRLLDAGLSQWDPDPRGATPMATQGEEE